MQAFAHSRALLRARCVVVGEAMGARPPPHVAGVSLMNNRSGNKYGSLHSASPSKQPNVWNVGMSKQYEQMYLAGHGDSGATPSAEPCMRNQRTRMRRAAPQGKKNTQAINHAKRVSETFGVMSKSETEPTRHAREGRPSYYTTGVVIRWWRKSLRRQTEARALLLAWLTLHGAPRLAGASRW